MNNLGVGYAKRHEQRRRSSMNVEQSEESGKLLIRGEDGLMREVEIVQTKEHESVFQKHCPVLPEWLAILCGFLNILPGLGSILAAFLNLCFALENNLLSGKCKTFGIQLLTGILQILTFPLIIGIVWSIRYGVQMIKKARDFKEEEPNPT